MLRRSAGAPNPNSRSGAERWNRADAAEALHDDRDLPHEPSPDEAFEAPELDDMQPRLVHISVGIEMDRHLAVALDPRDGRNLDQPCPCHRFLCLIEAQSRAVEAREGPVQKRHERVMNDVARGGAAWDLDVSPDGTGLPAGSGSVEAGEELFSAQCASCHGEFAEGVDNWPKLAGGDDTLADEDPVKTVGSYWPYLSTAWDYVHRSMPFGGAQVLSADETYAIVAYILYSNNLVEEDFVLSNENFLEVKMPNAEGFIVDDRPETEYAKWRGEPCMQDCKADVEITMRATVLDVTPDATGRGGID